ncbi:MAG: class I SAM-dependent methyltransferase [Actinomycetota bacterium]|nr:class I SAM-dependent methyltransferase [Actinomycetota bacterium]
MVGDTDGIQTAVMADHGIEIDWVALGPVLERGAEVHAPLYADAVRWLGSRVGRDTDVGGDQGEVRLVLDVGAGPGVITALLASTFPSARVIAVDGEPDLLGRTAARAARNGLGDRVETRVVDLPDGLDDLGDVIGAADVVWASHVLHHIGDQQDAVRRVGRLLRPGGLLGLAEGGLPTRSLPRDIGIGRPGLESRLDAAHEAWFAEMRAALPGARPAVEHWPGLLASAGLVPSVSRTFLLDLAAPLEDPVREQVRHRFERSRETLSGRIDADDLSVLDRLLDDHDGAHALTHREDVFLLTATTVHLAVAPAT